MATSRLFKILPTVVTLHCVKQNLRIYFESAYNTLQLEVDVFVVVNLLSLRKTYQKVFALSFELKETIPFSFNNILDCLPTLEGIPRDFQFREFFKTIFIFCSHFFKVNFFPVIIFLSKSFAHLKLP